MISKRNSIKDKRVDGMLFARNIVAAYIYYSPISIWMLSILGLFVAALPFSLMLVISINYLLIIAYLICGYLACAYLNNSFALTQDSLVIINPNFPFRQCQSYPLSDIKQITIDESKFNLFCLFGLLGSNYIEVQTHKASKLYFCVGLELDSFDENWTDNTIDTFKQDIRTRGVDVLFKLDDV